MRCYKSFENYQHVSPEIPCSSKHPYYLHIIPSSGFTISPVAFDSSAQTQSSSLTVINPSTDSTYLCKVYLNNEEMLSRTATLNVFGELLKYNIDLISIVFVE